MAGRSPRSARGGRSLSVDWPEELPEPTLDGSTATYADVFPDVDLKVIATVTGFRHVLVVGTPEAAQNPALETLDFGLQADGLSVRENAGGGLAAVEPNGSELFRAPAAHMWDSSGTGAGATEPSPVMPRSGSLSMEDAGPADSEEPERLDGPTPGDEAAPMEVSLADGTMSVTPDQGMLTSTPADEFPVNGVLQGTATVPGSWNAGGGLQIGRYLWAGQHQYSFNGSIDEVAVWQRQLTDAEVSQEARALISQQRAGVELVAAWHAASGIGTTVPDTVSGYGRDLTLTGGAVSDGQAIVLDGVDDGAGAPGPLVDDTGSFTVSTAVALNGTELAAKPIGEVGQVVGQRAADGSAWGLWFEMTGKETVLDDTGMEKTQAVGFWHFGRLQADGTFSSVKSDRTAQMDGLVQLTGVFDAQSGSISLYLSHTQTGETAGFTAEAGTGDFAVGRAFAGEAWSHHLPARIENIRVWAGAMAGEDQVRDVTGG